MMSFAELKRKLLAVGGVQAVARKDSKLTIRYTHYADHDRITVMQQKIAYIVAQSGLDISFIAYKAA